MDRDIYIKRWELLLKSPDKDRRNLVKFARKNPICSSLIVKQLSNNELANVLDHIVQTTSIKKYIITKLRTSQDFADIVYSKLINREYTTKRNYISSVVSQVRELPENKNSFYKNIYEKVLTVTNRNNINRIYAWRIIKILGRTEFDIAKYTTNNILRTYAELISCHGLDIELVHDNVKKYLIQAKTSMSDEELLTLVSSFFPNALIKNSNSTDSYYVKIDNCGQEIRISDHPSYYYNACHIVKDKNLHKNIDRAIRAVVSGKNHKRIPSWNTILNGVRQHEKSSIN